MKKANKMMALTMAAAMLVPQMAFAGESEQTTFNIFAGVSALSPDNSEKPLVQQMNEAMGVTIDWNCVSGDTLTEKKNLILNAGVDMPDAFMAAELSDYELINYGSYGVLIPLEDYINEETMPNLTALENVELALQICKDPLDARTVLEEVGLKERLTNFPAQLSGGEQQRVSIARALAKNPKLLLCDEPTGALDYQTGKAILKLLQDTSRERGMTVIVITHNSALTPMADRVIKIKNGKVSRMTENAHPTPVEEIEW
mgnify:CR=1 FL=1